MTIVESFACGTPVIASDTPNLTEKIYNGINGWVYSAGNADKLCAIIKNIDTASSNDYLQICEGAKKTYEQYFTEDAIYDKLMKIYNK